MAIIPGFLNIFVSDTKQCHGQIIFTEQSYLTLTLVKGFLCTLRYNVSNLGTKLMSFMFIIVLKRQRNLIVGSLILR